MDININNIGSELHLLDLFFKSVSCKRSDVIPDGTLDISVDNDYKVSKTENDIEQFTVNLKVKICNEDKSLKIDVKLVGIFECDFSGQSEEFRRQMITKNTVAIMFPYVRAQVSLLSTQPGMVPVIIPPINVNTLIEESEEIS